MHTVYIYKSEVNILISIAPDVQSCKEEHNQRLFSNSIAREGIAGRGLLESLAYLKLIYIYSYINLTRQTLDFLLSLLLFHFVSTISYFL